MKSWLSGEKREILKKITFVQLEVLCDWLGLGLIPALCVVEAAMLLFG